MEVELGLYLVYKITSINSTIIDCFDTLTPVNLKSVVFLQVKIT